VWGDRRTAGTLMTEQSSKKTVVVAMLSLVINGCGGAGGGGAGGGSTGGGSGAGGAASGGSGGGAATGGAGG